MVLAVICIKAIEPATTKLPDIKNEIRKVLALPVIRQLIVLAKVLLVESLKA